MSENTSYGENSLENITTGKWNSAFGAYSASTTTTGISNTSMGTNSLLKNNGSYNTALGTAALLENTDGNRNVSVGSNAMEFNTLGNDNIAIGAEALYTNDSGSQNIAIGTESLYNLVNTSDNVAIGNKSGKNDTSGSRNTYVGAAADTDTNDVYENSTALGYGATISASNQIVLGTSTETTIIPGVGLAVSKNSIFSQYSLDVSGNAIINAVDVGTGGGAGSNTLPYYNNFNTTIGKDALLLQENGNYNTATGWNALHYLGNGNYNTAVGQYAGFNETTGEYNTYIGGETDTDKLDIYSYSTAIGYRAIIDASNQIVLGTSTETTIIPGVGLAIGKRTLTSNASLDVNGNAIISNKDVGTGSRSGSNELTPEQNNNTAVGFDALYNQTTGNYNQAFGDLALSDLTTGSCNTAVGYQALLNTTNGNYNTAIGHDAGEFKETYLQGSYNTFVGADAKTDVYNVYNNSTALGYGATIDASNQIVLGTSTETVYVPGNQLCVGGKYTIKDEDTFDISTNQMYIYTLGNAYIAATDFGVGSRSGKSKITLAETWNTAAGASALFNQTNGNYNQAFGDLTLFNLIDGSCNTAVGYQALNAIVDGSLNTAIGYQSGVNDASGCCNTYLGANTDVSENDVIYNNSTAIGYGAKIDASNQIVLGTSTESVYFRGGLNYSVGPAITLDGSYLKFPLSVFNLISQGVVKVYIPIPNETSNVGAYIIFKNNTDGSVTISTGDDPSSSHILATGSASVLTNEITLSSGATTSFISSGATVWIQL